MKLRKNKTIVLLIVLIIILILIVFETNTIALSRYGSRGAEVSQIQTKLKRWGYYNGNVDGIYGSQTLAAVKYFQRSNGLTVDGIAGTKTLNERGAFDAVSDGQINLTPDSTARKAAQDALNGWDPSYGAIYYFNPNTATSAWIWSRPMTVTIGNHRFCK